MPSLKSFSLTHVQYENGDILGLLMAVITLIPIAILVAYGTLFAGFILAKLQDFKSFHDLKTGFISFISQSAKVISPSGKVSSRKAKDGPKPHRVQWEWVLALIAAGQIFNEILNWILKTIIKESRPNHAVNHGTNALAIKHV